jgi:hypothetical protein
MGADGLAHYLQCDDFRVILAEIGRKTRAVAGIWR